MLGVVVLSPSLSWPEARSVLAHELAHMSLGHASLATVQADQEADASVLAAQRLIGIEAFAAALVWCGDDMELSVALGCDAESVQLRREGFSAAEVRRVEELVQELEGPA